MKIEDGIKLDFDDVLIKPKRSETASRKDVDIQRTFRFKYSDKILSGTPIIAANMDTTGSMAMAKALSELGCYTALHKFYEQDKLANFFHIKNELVRQHTFYTLGITKEDFSKFEFVTYHTDLPLICIDVANGYRQSFVDYVAKIRELSPKSIIMAGNVATPEMVEEILIHGKADIVKIGIGPGKFCVTRKVTGVGYSQLSAVLECADAAHGIPGGLICSDGGCESSGDIAKAFGGNSDFVMLGNLLAGASENDGEWSEDKQELSVYGMSSKEAHNKYYGGLDDYKSSEGACMAVKAKGPVKDIVKQIFGGLRSACSYVGARNLKDLGKCTTFIRINPHHGV